VSIAVNTGRIIVFLWKELREYTRDKKAIISTVILPPLALIAIGLVTVLLAIQKPLVISLINEDRGDVALQLSTMLASELTKAGYKVLELGNLTEARLNPQIDLIVVIPQGFTDNATSWDRVAHVRIYKRTGISGEQIDMAENRVRGVLAAFSSLISAQKISELAKMANITINIDAVRNPIQVEVPVYVGVHGEPAKVEDVWRPFIARLLILSFSFIVTPATTYVIDGIVGERERKTMEMLIASPLGVREFIVAKTITASIIGLISALSDLLGLYLYTTTLAYMIGSFILSVIDPGLIFLHATISFLTIIATISLSLPFISRTRGIKSASSVASIITTLGLAFYIAGWVVDFYKLPITTRTALLLVPYTHSIMAIQAYVYSDYTLVALCTLVLLILSILLVYASTKILDREKVLLAQTYYT
jgi:ABC-2 type transport system permease protein